MTAALLAPRAFRPGPGVHPLTPTKPTAKPTAQPTALGYRTMTMLTGSMSPGIDPGDVIVVTPLPISEVEAGMVISYHIPIDDHRLVSHRVLAVETSPDGAVTVQTQGDANDAPDPWQATLQGDTAWQVTAVIPELGK